MRLWVDDIRPSPEGFEHIQTAEEAIELLKQGGVLEISLDHDLGEGPTGYDIARWIEQQAFCGTLRSLIWHLHTDNPVGRKNMEMALLNAERFWQREVSPEQ